MLYDISHALPILRPNAQWILVGFDYSGLEWKDNIQSKPTMDELTVIIHQLNTEEPMRLLRIERNKRLDDCRWIVEKYFSRGESLPQEWKDYMQALRDLPTTSSPTLDEKGNLELSSVNFPIQPSNF